MRLTLAFVPRPGSAAVVRAASPRPRRAIFYYRPLPQHRHWCIWAKPPPFCLRWRNVPGTRRNERTGFGLHGNWKKEFPALPTFLPPPSTTPTQKMYMVSLDLRKLLSKSVSSHRSS